MNKKELYLLRFGAFQTMGMAVYHFFLPTQFGWSNHIPESLATISWALLMLNNSFSFNLFILSGFLMYFAFNRQRNTQTLLVLTAAVLAFWIFSAVYQIAVPMPLPERLEWIGMLLPAVAVLNAAILAVPTRVLWKLRKT